MSLTSPLRALVVDDEVLIRKGVARALNREGFSCDEASDGNAALEKLRETSYDIAICDLRMPESHGHNLIVAMLEMESRPAIVVLTGLVEIKLVRDLLARGVEDVLMKPANYEVMAAKAKFLALRFQPLEASGDSEAGPEHKVRLEDENPQDRESSSFAVKADYQLSSRSEQIGPAAIGNPVPATANTPRASFNQETTNRSDSAIAEERRKCERVAEQVQVIRGGLQTPPPEYDAFRIASANAVGMTEMAEAIESLPTIAINALSLANSMLFHASEQLKSAERSHAMIRTMSPQRPPYLVAALALVLGVLVGKSINLLL